MTYDHDQTDEHLPSCPCAASSAFSFGNGTTIAADATPASGFGSRIRRRINFFGTKLSLSHVLAREEKHQLAEEIKICKCYVKNLERMEQRKYRRRGSLLFFPPRFSTSANFDAQEDEGIVDVNAIEDLLPQYHGLSESECLSSIRRGHRLLRRQV